MKFFALMLYCVFASVSAMSLGDSGKLYNDTKPVAKKLLRGSAVIDIQVVIDTHSLVQKYKTGSKDPKKPKAIAHEYAFMVTPRKYVVSGQATADLHMKAAVGDIFRYFGTSPSNNLNSQVFVYDLKFYPRGYMSPPVNTQLNGTPCVEIPDGENIKEVIQSKCNNFYLSSNTKKPGRIDYHISFALYEKNDETNLMELNGYYEWDPTITIS